MRFVVSPAQGGGRLDQLVAHAAAVSRRVARLWIAQGSVRVNRRVVRILTRPIAAGATVEIAAQPERAAAPVAPPPRTIEILHLDKWVLVVNKPPRLLSEHDRFGSPSLESVLPPLLRAQGQQDHLWLVHRLDAGTSGVMVLARTPMAVRQLSAVFREGAAEKIYLALCQGVLRRPARVDAPLARAQGTRHAVTQNGKPALTDVKPLAAGQEASLVQARPRTGRTHQIRVHLQHLGHPLLGDRLYGGPGFTCEQPPRPIGRPMLHALQLSVPHPKHGTPLVLRAPPPADFVDTAATYGIVLQGP